MSNFNTNRFVAVRTNRGYEVRDTLWNAVPSRKDDVVIVEDSLCHNFATARLFARKYEAQWEASRVARDDEPYVYFGTNGKIFKFNC